jgi:MinD-like ATPase involved in chromosome partitioning or flagellar assembly
VTITSVEAPNHADAYTESPSVPGPVGCSMSAPAGLAPLLAVCDVVGGAGATTLSYLIARAAAQRSPKPVLVADTGGPSGALAALARVEVARSLGALAEQLAAGIPLAGGLYGTGEDGVRVLASAPELATTRACAQIRRLLADAREAHPLTVIDCGTLAREADQTALASASHVAWVLPASAHGISSGRRLLNAVAPVAGQELLLARRDARAPSAPLRELRHLAAQRHAPLVLVPHLPGLDAGRHDAALDAAQVPLAAILGALSR